MSANVPRSVLMPALRSVSVNVWRAAVSAAESASPPSVRPKLFVIWTGLGE